MPDSSPIRPWRTSAPRELFKTRLFTVMSAESVSPTDPSRRGEFLHLRFPDWANVIAVTRDDRIVMVEQFRHGLGQVTLELPGGIVEPGESPESACARELAEEAGYAGRPAAIIGRASANPAIQNNWVYTGLVRDAAPTAALDPDEHEEIAVRLIPRTEIPDLIRRGVIHHAIIIAALHYFSLAEP